MEAAVRRILELPLPLAVVLLLLENLLIFALALIVGRALVRRHAERRCAPPPPPLRAEECLYAVCTVLLNTVVTVAGFWLARRGVIRFRPDSAVRLLVDAVALLVIMDAAMYGLHRLAHHRWIYPLLHRPHHRYDRPRPLTLFVLSPPETISFGALWLAVLYLYPASYLGMSLYLALNVAFGTIGHLGVEPCPRGWVSWPVVRQVSTSTFHAGHHLQPAYNFGFYTLVWDRLFGTLAPAYEDDFRKAALPRAGAPAREPS